MVLQIVKQSRPWVYEDLPSNIVINDHDRGRFVPNLSAYVIETMKTDDFIQARGLLRNNLFNCNTCSSLHTCLETITGRGYLGDVCLTRGRMVTTMINEMFNGERCMACAEYTKFQSALFPSGWACSQECENKMKKYLDYIDTPHRLRAMWYKDLDLGSLRFMYNEPHCGLHRTNKACMLHYVNNYTFLKAKITKKKLPKIFGFL